MGSPAPPRDPDRRHSGTPLLRKLGIRSGDRVAVFHPPDHIDDLLEPPDDVELEPDPPPPDTSDATDRRSRDIVLLFARDREVLEGELAAARQLLTWDGGLWICWPKQSSSLSTDLKSADVRAAGLEAGLVDNKVCAVDEDWSALRFVYRVEDRP